MFEEIQKYADLEWTVFACNPESKTPATPNGHKDATTDVDILAQWWATNPDYNVGVFCKPSGFFVVDIDPRSGGLDSFDKLEALLDGELPATVEAETGIHSLHGREVRGRHLYFKYDGNEKLLVNLLKADLPGIDIKHNGYVILPPSTHHSGVKYSWKPGHAPWEMAMAYAPEALLAELVTHSSARTSVSPISLEEMTAFISASTDTTDWGAAALASELETLSETPEGHRNDDVFASGCRIGQLIAGAQVNGDEALTKLVAVATDLGLEKTEITSILFREDGAIARGLAEPRKPEQLAIDNDYLQIAQRMNAANEKGQIVSGSEAINRSRIIDWEVLFSSEEIDEEWFVPGFICAKRNHSLYSDAGLGKSLLMREIAASLASGRVVLGYEPFPRQVKVLYLDYENNPHGDIKKSLKDMGFGAKELDGYLFLASFPAFAPLDTEQGASQLLEVVDEIQPELVIIDTVSRVISGKENENDTWNRLYSFLGEKLKQREIAVLRLDHEGKNAEAGARGGSAKRGDVDLVWHYERKGAKFKMTCEKSRGSNALEWFEVTRFMKPLLHHSITKTSGLEHTGIAALLEKAQPYLHAEDIIRKAIDANDGVLIGQTVMWRKLSDQFQDEDVSKRIFEDMHRTIKRELEGFSSYTTEELQEIFGEVEVAPVAPVAPGLLEGGGVASD